MPVNYVKYEFESHEKLVRLRMQLPQEPAMPQLQEWRGQIEAEQENMQDHRFRVAVVGEFNRGKSTFLNALLGQQILPADILPATATINRIVYGPVPKAYLYYKDGTREEVAVEDLSDYITKRTEESSAYAAKVAEAVVEFPSIFCQNHVDLIDTPGMNESERMEDVTLAQLGNIDLAIMVVSAVIPFGESEAWFMEKLLESDEISQIIVVVTGMDRLYDEEERERLLALLHKRIPELVAKQLDQKLQDDEQDENQPVRRKYERIFSHLQTFGVSSTDALKGLAENDHALYQGSGFPELTKQLPSLILTSQNDSTILRPLGLVRRIMREYQTAVPALREQMVRQHQKWREERIAFGEETYSYASQMADTLKDRMFALVDGFAQLSEAACKEYIVCLSSIREFDTNVIGQTLEARTADLLLRYNEICSRNLEPELDKAVSGWREACQNTIQEIRSRIHMADFLEEDSKVKMDEFLVRLQSEQFSICPFEKKPFSWTHSPVATYAFMDPALIEYVHKGVRDSFRDYQIMRREQIMELTSVAADSFMDVLEQIVVQVFLLTNQQMIKDEHILKKLESEDIARGFRKLEEDTDELEKEFGELMIRSHQQADLSEQTLADGGD